MILFCSVKQLNSQTFTSTMMWNSQSTLHNPAPKPSGYSSSNIIKMLRVKQEVMKDARLNLSKEQLLTRLITTEQEYKNLKNNLDYRNTHKMLERKQVSTAAISHLTCIYSSKSTKHLQMSVAKYSKSMKTSSVR